MSPIRSAELELRVVASGIDHPECVTWFEERLYCGTESGSVLEINPRDGAVSVVGNTGGFVLGLTVSSAAQCIVCDSGRHEVLLMGLDGDTKLLARRAGHRPLVMPNYPLILPGGDILVSDSGSRWGSDDGFLFRIDPRTLESSVVAADCTRFPNGLVLAPDARSIYLVESRLPGVVQYQLVDGLPVERRVVVELPRTVPDGLAFDTAGNLYISCWRPDRVYRLKADGLLEVFLDDFTAEYLNSPTNICFGGKDYRTLFLAGLCGWAINAIDMEIPGIPHGPGKRQAV